MRAAQVAAGRGLRRRPADEHHAGQRGRDVRVADPGQRLGHRGVRAQDDRLRGHQPARGARRVAQQPAHRRRLLGLHQRQQRLRLGVRQLAAAGRRRRPGTSPPARRRPARRPGGPAATRRSASDISSNTSASRSSSSASITSNWRFSGSSCSAAATSAGRIVSNTDSRPSVPCRSDSDSPVTARHGTIWICPRRDSPRRGGAHRQPADHPVPGPGRLDRGVHHDHLGAVVDQPDPGVQQLPDQQRLVRPLGEPAQADRAGGQRDRARVDRGDPQHRHEDPPPGGQLDDHAEHPRRAGVHPQRRPPGRAPGRCAPRPDRTRPGRPAAPRRPGRRPWRSA